jgi:hypothetical protein
LLELLKTDVVSAPIDIFRKHWSDVNRETEAAAKAALAAKRAESAAGKESKTATTPGQRTTPYNDFRNSRFDVKQNFAEGFDPDRIAVAFSNDLASLGEKRMQSGFAPLYSVR